MPMYNLIHDNYAKTTVSLWQYFRDEPVADDDIENSESFESKKR